MLILRRQPFIGINVGQDEGLAERRPSAAIPFPVDGLPDSPAIGIVLVAGDEIILVVSDFSQPVSGVVLVFLVVRRVLPFCSGRGGFLDQAAILVPGVGNRLAVAEEQSGVFRGAFQ